MRASLLLTLALLTSFLAAADSGDRRTLLAEILPPGAPAWPPCQVAVHAPGLVPASAEAMRAEALARQDRLIAVRRTQLPVDAGDEDDAARETLLAYAFGERTAEEACAALATAEPKWRIGLVRLLLADAEVESGVATAREVLLRGPADLDARAAAGLLVEVARDRAALATMCPLMPLSDDPAAILTGLRADAAWIAWLSWPRLAGLPLGDLAEPLSMMTEHQAQWWQDRVLIYPESLRDWRATATNRSGVSAGLCLDTAAEDFHLHRRDGGWPRRGSVVIDCRSVYHGPIRFALHRCADDEDWERLDPVLLAEATVERRWSETFLPLADCNRGAAVIGSTRIDGLKPGWYVVSARARGAPVLAAQRFAVGAAQLTLLADHERVVVVAVDRDSGEPASGLAIRLWSEVGDESSDLGVVTTAADGSAVAVISPAADTTRALTVAAALVADQRLGATRTTVPARLPGQPILRATLWSATALIEPGGTAHLAGVLRETTGPISRVPPADTPLPRLELVYGVTVVASTVVSLDEHGRFAWSWPVPRDARAGLYKARILDHDWDAFTIKAKPLPVMALSADSDRSYGTATYMPGETVRIQARIRDWNNVALAGVPVQVEGLPAVLVQPEAVVSDAWGRAELEVILPAGLPPQSLTAQLVAVAADGRRAAGAVTVTITDQPFATTHPLWNDRDPIVGTVAELPLVISDWGGHPIAQATVRCLESGASAVTDVAGAAVLTLPTDTEGERRVTIAAEQAGRRTQTAIAYTVQPQPQRQPAQEIAGEPLARLDESMPAARTIGIAVTAANCPEWTPWVNYARHRYAIADGSPCQVQATLGPRADRERPVTAVVWAASDRLLTHRVLRVAAGDTIQPLALERAWEPQATVGVVVLDGDHSLRATTTVQAMAPEHLLQVRWTDGDREVRPGQVVDLDLTISDGTGAIRPGCALVCRGLDLAAPEVGRRWRDRLWFRRLGPLAVADLSIVPQVDGPYPIRDGQRWWTMGLPAWSWHEPDLHLGLEPTSRACGPPRLVHWDWSRLALWRTDLVSDAQGRARLQVTMPAEVTTWVVAAWAVADDGAFGSAEVYLSSAGAPSP